MAQTYTCIIIVVVDLADESRRINCKRYRFVWILCIVAVAKHEVYGQYTVLPADSLVGAESLVGALYMEWVEESYIRPMY